MTDQRLSHSEPVEPGDARATMLAHAREAFAHDLERQRKQAELIEELSRASADMQTQVERREHLMNAMLDAQATSSDLQPASRIVKPASDNGTTPEGITRASPPEVAP